jgi:hypothetical protein
MINTGHRSKQKSWAQCYKTFYVRKLQIFVISYSVCHRQAFLVYYNKHSSLVRKYVNHEQESLTLAPVPNVMKFFTSVIYECS